MEHRLSERQPVGLDAALKRAEKPDVTAQACCSSRQYNRPAKASLLEVEALAGLLSDFVNKKCIGG